MNALFVSPLIYTKIGSILAPPEWFLCQISLESFPLLLLCLCSLLSALHCYVVCLQIPYNLHVLSFTVFCISTYIFSCNLLVFCDSLAFCPSKIFSVQLMMSHMPAIVIMLNLGILISVLRDIPW